MEFMTMRFIRKLPIPQEIKERYPVSVEIEEIKKDRDRSVREILNGNDKRMLLIIGPCSADNPDSVIDYINRLKEVQEKVADKILIVPRIYTNKPRSIGTDYKGMLHQPDPEKSADMLKGLIAIRELHLRAVKVTGFTCADEMLYPENLRYLSDLLSYITVGARSSENQQHRLVSSGAGVPVGMKNPTSGDLRVMLNSITTAQSPNSFLYRGWEVQTPGNEYAHAILRGYVDRYGKDHPNYHYEDLTEVCRLYADAELKNPALIIDCNHANSGKDHLKQIRISKEVLNSRRESNDIKSLIKGLMIESYLEDGRQDEHTHCYGRSITDPCLGWDKTERLIFDLAELWV